MSPRPFILLFSAALLLFSCLPTRYGLEGLPPVQLHIGSGGGVTGAFQEYLLLRNGQVFLFESQAGQQDTFELEALARSEAGEVFRQLNELRLIRYDFNYPGDTYQYIRQMDEQVEHVVQWGDARWSVRSDVEQFYKDLRAQMKDRRVIRAYGKEAEGEEPKEPTFW